MTDHMESSRMSTRKCFWFVVLGLMLASPTVAQDSSEKKTVVATLPTISALVMEVGGDKLEITSLARPDEDPHFVSPTPHLMNRVRQAELLFEIGMLQDRWVDRVADGSGNSRITRGAPGRVTTSIGVPKEEVPDSPTRAQGDLHPEGNPHLWLDPLRAKMMAANITRALARAYPSDSDYFGERLDEFEDRIDRELFGEELVRLVGSRKLTRLAMDGELFDWLEQQEVGGEKLITKLGGWLQKAAPLRGQRAVEYHKVWVYLCQLLDLELIGTIEEKPGIPPGPRYQREITERIRNEGVRLILVDNFYDPGLPNAIARGTSARVVVLPSQVGGEPGTDDYFQLIDTILEHMVAAFSEGS